MIGRVYRINVNENDFYIGSTIKRLCERQAHHNNRLKDNFYKYKLYEKCRENNITNIICILLEQKEVEDIDEIRELEQEYIDKLQPTLNHKGSYLSQDNKEYHKEYSKEWRKNNKEHIKDYYINNKDKISESRAEKIKCPICNSIVSRRNISTHKKSKKCRKVNECFIQED